jgi:4-carboxymuconolactone decarboxylase
MPPIAEADMTEAQKQAAAAFKASRGMDIVGPFIPLLRSPEALPLAAAMGGYFRHKSALPPLLSEFVILLTAAYWGAEFEWAAHYAHALKAGMKPATGEAIAAGRKPENLSPEEAALYDFCVELRTKHSVSDSTYERMVNLFGERGVVDTMGIVGYYSMLAMMLNVARFPANPSDAPALQPAG